MSYSGSKRKRISKSYRPYKRRHTYGGSRMLRGIKPRAPLRTGGYYFPSKELKFLDVASTGGIAFGNNSTGATGAVSFVLLNGCIPGTSATNRIGRKISMKNLNMRCYYDTQPTSGSGFVRTMLIYDMQSNGVAPTAADVFLNGSTPFITMPLNLDNRDRFKVIHDRTRYISAGSGLSDTNMIYYKKYFKRLGLPTIYNAGSAGTVADIQTGALYLIVMTTCPTANLNARVETRIRFADD